MYEAPPQTILHDTEVWPDREKFENGPMMNHLREQHDVFHLTSANANPNASWFDYVVLMHGSEQSTLSESDRLVLRFLLNHIAKANATRRPLTLLQKKYQAVFAVLDRLAFGVALLDDEKNIIASNKAAEKIFDAGDCLIRTKHGQLSAIVPAADVSLNAQIEAAVMAAQREETTILPACALARRTENDPIIVEATPFSDSHTGEMNISLNGAILFFLDPESSHIHSTDGLSAAYQLTPAESKICQQIVDGMSNDTIAEIENIALSTVKTLSLIHISEPTRPY